MLFGVASSRGRRRDVGTFARAMRRVAAVVGVGTRERLDPWT